MDNKVYIHTMPEKCKCGKIFSWITASNYAPRKTTEILKCSFCNYEKTLSVMQPVKMFKTIPRNERTEPFYKWMFQEACKIIVCKTKGLCYRCQQKLTEDRVCSSCGWVEPEMYMPVPEPAELAFYSREVGF